MFAVLIGDVPIHYQPDIGECDGVDDLEVRGPFDTRPEAEQYAIDTARHVTIVVPLNEPTPDR